LKRIVKYVHDRSAFYRGRFDEHGLQPSDIGSVDQIQELPFTTKDDLRDQYPYGLFSQIFGITEIHVSSGTTGVPTLVGYSKNDVNLWSDVMARSFACAGVKPGDVFQNAYGYGLFTGGLGFHYGAVELGLSVIPCSSGQTLRQLRIMQDLEPRILGCTPSYSLYLAEEARESGLDPRDSSWEIGMFGAEPWSETMRAEIEEALGITALDTYGLSEIIGPGVAQECRQKNGLHLFSDVFFPEVIDPASGDPVAEGEDGELVITTLSKEAMPLIRYRTRDIVSLTTEPCACGRTSPRISRIKGRTDDMIVVRGINVFPSQVEHVLLGIPGTSPNYQLIVDRKATSLDTLELRVEAEDHATFANPEERIVLEEKIVREMTSVLTLRVHAHVVEPKAIGRSEGKAIRVVDRRPL
jgi:phenylacetate-CoA ligase